MYSAYIIIYYYVFNIDINIFVKECYLTLSFLGSHYEIWRIVILLLWLTGILCYNNFIINDRIKRVVYPLFVPLDHRVC